MWLIISGVRVGTLSVGLVNRLSSTLLLIRVIICRRGCRWNLWRCGVLCVMSVMMMRL